MDLPTAQLHIWRASLDAWESYHSKLASVLSQDELDRLQRYRAQADRNRFLVGRGLLRQIAGEYLRIDPASLQIDHGQFGKPFLPARSHLHFNLAHSGDLIIYAFSTLQALGIDIEQNTPKVDIQASAPQFCCAGEIEELARLPVEARQKLFFRLWVRKEALFKAMGQGLSAFDSVQPRPSAQENWQVQDLDIAPGYAAAIAVEGRCPKIEFFNADELNFS
jgi:4'-phosphopantetheinyl transferase